TALILTGGTLASAAASATTIGFDNLPGPNGTPLTTYTEGGFTVTGEFTGMPPTPTFFQALSSGHPPPSVFAGPSGGTVDVTMNGGEFNFASIEVAFNDHFTDFTFTGSLRGMEQFSFGLNCCNADPSFTKLTSLNPMPPSTLCKFISKALARPTPR